MRSRYSAYALGLPKYIIATTHPDNSDFTDETKQWGDSILDFSQHTHFNGLTIHEFIDGDTEAFVTFEALLSSGVLSEKSRFLKREGKWLYESGNFE